MTSKVRLRLGDVEIECEGSEEFLKQEVPTLLKAVMELHGPPRVTPPREPAKGDPGGQVKVGSLTTGSIAAKLGAKTGPDLLIAGAARLAIVLNTEPFTRKQLLGEMKSATAYYDKNYRANLSRMLKSALQDDRLTETATNSFALTPGARAEIEKKLANP